MNTSKALATLCASCASITLAHAESNLRQDLEQQSISTFLYYDSIFAANVSGGLEDDDEFAGQLYTGATFDLETLLDWKSATAQISLVNRHGDTISPAVGGIYDPMTIYGGQTTFLYDFWLEKEFNDTFSLKAGRLSADQDFAKSPLYGYSSSTSINGAIRALLLDGAHSSFPFPIWGARAKFNLDDGNVFKLGIYHLSERMFDATANGLDFDIDSDDGFTVMAQYDWSGQLFDHAAKAFVGVNQAFYDLDKLDGSDTRDGLTRFFAHLDLEITKDLTLFSFLSYSAQDDVAITPLQASFGANYSGLFSRRPEGRTFFYATYGSFSEKLPIEIGESERNAEWVFELGHRYQMSKTSFLQPAIQRIVHPSGRDDIDDATVLGIWMGFSF